VLLLVPGWTMPTQFSLAFLHAVFIAFSAFKIPWRVFHSATNSTSALNSLHWLPIRQRIDYKLATIVHRSLHNACPQYLSYLLHTYTPTRQLHSTSLNLLSQPRAKMLSPLVVFSILAPPSSS